MALCSIKTVADLGRELVLAPERYDPRREALASAGRGALLGDLAEPVRLMVGPGKSARGGRFLVLDTSDAKEGVIVCRKPDVAIQDIGSTKKTVERGCVLVSRLRPYLRQVALADGEIPGWSSEVNLLCSTEFFVLRPLDTGPIAFLVPFLLSSPVQTVLAASQEGGHHPRFDLATLLDLPVPRDLLDRRDVVSREVEEYVTLFRQSERGLHSLIQDAGSTLNGERQAASRPRKPMSAMPGAGALSGSTTAKSPSTATDVPK